MENPNIQSAKELIEQLTEEYFDQAEDLEGMDIVEIFNDFLATLDSYDMLGTRQV